MSSEPPTTEVAMFRVASSHETYALSHQQMASPLFDHNHHIDRAVTVTMPSPSTIITPLPLPGIGNKSLTFSSFGSSLPQSDSSNETSNAFFAGTSFASLSLASSKSLADVQLHTVVVPSSTSSSSSDVPSPPLAPRFLETFTTFTTTRADIVASSSSPLLSWLHAARVSITPSRSCRHRIHCTLAATNDIAAVRFRVNAFTTATGSYIVEVQRRSGDSVQLSSLYRALTASLTGMGLVVASSPAAVAPTMASLSSSPVAVPSFGSSLSLPSFITLPSIVMPLPTPSPSLSSMNGDASLVSSLQVQLSSTCADIRREALHALLSLSSSVGNHRLLTTSSMIGQLTTLVTSSNHNDARDAAMMLSSLSATCGSHPSTLTIAVPAIMAMLYATDNGVRASGVRALHTICGAPSSATTSSGTSSPSASRVVLRQMELVDKRNGRGTSDGVMNQLMMIHRTSNGSDAMITSLLQQFSAAITTA